MYRIPTEFVTRGRIAKHDIHIPSNAPMTVASDRSAALPFQAHIPTLFIRLPVSRRVPPCPVPLLLALWAVQLPSSWLVLERPEPEGRTQVWLSVRAPEAAKRVETGQKKEGKPTASGSFCWSGVRPYMSQGFAAKNILHR